MKLKKIDCFLIVSFILMRFADIISTYLIINSGLGEEGNPIMKILIVNLYLILIYNTVLIILVICIFYYFNYRNEKILLNIYEVVIYTLSIIGFTIIYFNSLLMRVI